MKRKLKKLLQFLTNPRLLLCYGLAWMVTNGWSYVLFTLGAWLQINWMAAVGSAYLTFLWLPISPEKLVTFPLTIVLLRWLFPNDQKTLAVMKNKYAQLKDALRRKKQERREKKNKN